MRNALSLLLTKAKVEYQQGFFPPALDYLSGFNPA